MFIPVHEWYGPSPNSRRRGPKLPYFLDSPSEITQEYDYCVRKLCLLVSGIKFETNNWPMYDFESDIRREIFVKYVSSHTVRFDLG